MNSDNISDQELLQELFSDETMAKKDFDRAAVMDNGIRYRDPSIKRVDSTKNSSTPGPADSFGGLMTVHDKRFLDQHVMINEDVTEDVLYSFLLNELIILSDGFKNYREFSEQKKIIGNYFDETRQGCYRMELFNYRNETKQDSTQLGINCTRLEGDGLAVTSLWNSLKESLAQLSYLETDDIEFMNETDDEGFFSCDEDEIMDDFKYLDFSRDAGFVGRLIDDIEDVNVGTHSLLLLSHNCESSKNLNFLSNNFVNRNFAQEMIDRITNRLADANARYVNLPVARCAAKLVNSTMKEPNALQINKKQMQILLNTVENWSSESYDKRQVAPSASEEVSCQFTEVLGELQKSLTEDYDFSEQLQRIYETTDFDSVRDKIGAFLPSN